MQKLPGLQCLLLIIFVPDLCLSVIMVSGTGLVIVRSAKFVLRALTPPFFSLNSGSHSPVSSRAHFYLSTQLFCIIFLLVRPVFREFVIEGTSLKIPFPGGTPFYAHARPNLSRIEARRKNLFMESLRKCPLDYRCVARFVWYR